MTRQRALGGVVVLAALMWPAAVMASLPTVPAHAVTVDALSADVVTIQVALPRLEYVVIGNATGLTAITEKQAQAILRGERTLWDSKLPVTVVLPGQRAAYADSLTRDLMGMSRAAMQRYWLALVFQGRAAPPVFHESVEETVVFVRRTPGAIAIIPAGQGGDLRELLIPWR